MNAESRTVFNFKPPNNCMWSVRGACILGKEVNKELIILAHQINFSIEARGRAGNELTISTAQQIIEEANNSKPSSRKTRTIKNLRQTFRGACENCNLKDLLSND